MKESHLPPLQTHSNIRRTAQEHDSHRSHRSHQLRRPPTKRTGAAAMTTAAKCAMPNSCSADTVEKKTSRSSCLMLCTALPLSSIALNAFKLGRLLV